MRPAYTFVCADSVPRAWRWCRENGIGPMHVGTRIVTPLAPHAGRGCMLAGGDRVVVLTQRWDASEWLAARAALVPAGLGSTVQPEFVV